MSLSFLSICLISLNSIRNTIVFFVISLLCKECVYGIVDLFSSLKDMVLLLFFKYSQNGIKHLTKVNIRFYA